MILKSVQEPATLRQLQAHLFLRLYARKEARTLSTLSERFLDEENGSFRAVCDLALQGVADRRGHLLRGCSPAKVGRSHARRGHVLDGIHQPETGVFFAKVIQHERCAPERPDGIATPLPAMSKAAP